MHCAKCGSENPAGNNFCVHCGNALLGLCAKCGAENAPTSNFCGKCGAALSAPVSPSVPATAPIQAPEVAGERRHLSILFCDLVGSVTLAARLDPEEWRATVAGYQRAAAEAITRFGGEVARYVGDGIMAFFGYPAAHDNDAERAARAGLAILDAIAELNEQPAHPKLSVRIGIDSGRVVVGTGTGNAVDAFGDAANIAARVQAAAEPGAVLVTGETHRLISGLFVVEDRGAHALKGMEREITLYRVMRPSGMRGRLAAAAATRALTPFVGREDELRTMMSRWERAVAGEGQVVTIIGEPGIGKSRLVQEFRERIAGERHTWLECATAAFFQNTPFYATAEMLRQSFHWHGDQNHQRLLAALEASLAATGVEIEGAVPLIAALLDLPLGDKYPPLGIPPDQQRRRLLATLVAWTMGAAKAQPLVIATEDLHWADPSTLEVTQLLVEQGATAPLMLIYTARPEFRAPWSMRAHHTQITLNRLGARDIRTIIAQVAASKALSDETVATVVERTGGVPLFVEELTRAVLESGDAKLSGRDIPATLHDSLMARLDRLGAAKEVAQVGAVLGREFSYELLHAVHEVPEPELQAALGELAEAELLYVQGLAPNANYQFKHALIRDAAYEALLKSRRKELHLIVARTIDEKFPTFKETHPEVLARHWTEAGEIEPAIAEWQRAGDRAVEGHAYREAEQHYREALALINALPEAPERNTRELNLQIALGRVMEATRGFSAAETASVYAQAKSLAERGACDDSLQVFYGLWSSAHTQGEQRPALALADQMLENARNIGTARALAIAHYAQANTHHYLGDLVEARKHYLLAIEHYRGEDFHEQLVEPGTRSLSWAGNNEWYLGYPDGALRYVDDAHALARRRNEPFNLAFAFSVATQVYGLRGDLRRMLDANRETVRLSTEFGFPLWNSVGKIRGAWARSQMKETEPAVDEIRKGLAELDSQKFYLARGNLLRMLCETQALAGSMGDALTTLEQALQTNPDELIYRPYLLRLRGELRLKSGAGGKANFELSEQDFHEAIELARSMNAKSLELRATMSLGGLLEHQGRREEARALLAEIYNWFTEGFDTADLKDAKALLDELGS